MRTGVVLVAIVTSCLVLAGVTNAQNTGGGSAQPANPSSGALPPGLQNRQELPPGLRNRQELPPGLAGATNGLSRFSTNRSESQMTRQDRAVTETDRTLLVRIRETVQTKIQPRAGSAWMPVHFDVDNAVVTVVGTVETEEQKEEIVTVVQQTPGVANVVDELSVGTGTGAVASQGVQAQGQVAGSQELLLRVRQAVLPQIQVGSIPAPVQFNVEQEGVVVITGVVPTIEQKHQIAALVKQVPGVVDVQDRTQVNPSVTANGAGGGVGMSSSNSIAGGFGGSSNGNSSGTVTNLTPTGRTNAGELPPGLENRGELPPGLEKREQLPPGFNRTNSPGQ